MINNFQYDVLRAGLMPEPDGTYIFDQNKTILMNLYFDRKQRDLEDPFKDHEIKIWDDL